jgi:hypothetical protein
MVVELNVVVRVAPDQRAAGSAFKWGVECRRGVGPCVDLADSKAARMFTGWDGRLAELGEQYWDICGEPAGELGQKGDQLLVGGTSRPARVDGITVHRHEIAPATGFCRADQTIVLDVLHVRSDGDSNPRITGSQDRRDSLQPPVGCVWSRWDGAVRVLVPEIRSPHCGMPGERRRDMVRKENL